METRSTNDDRAGSTQGSGRVRYSFACADLSDQLVVDRFLAVEELGRPYEMTVLVRAVDDATDMFDLLGRNAQLVLERGTHKRELAGVVARVALKDHAILRQSAEITVRPALAALELRVNSRVFQDRTALEIIEQVLREGLEPYGRACDGGELTAGSYPVRNYCVQYQETDFAFVHRLMEEEGIGYYFEHHDVERMRLFDRNRALPAVATIDGGPVRFEATFRDFAASEQIVRFAARARLGSGKTTVRDHDWTRRQPTVETANEAELGPHEHAHEVYEHGFERHLTITEDGGLLANLMTMAQQALLPSGMPEGAFNRRVLALAGVPLPSFTADDGERQASVRREGARRDVRTAEGIGLVTGFSPGRHFELAAHPTLGADGAYLLTRVVHSSEAPEVDGDRPAASEFISYHNRFECIPLETPWRPARRTPRPRVYGIQTARVTGPAGLDIYTDAHGRIRVKFQWDRADDLASGEHSCWIRCSQAWAGDGMPGFVFIPRVGMEVVVAFVDGNPDRPLVTGCVYNGANPTPALLPIEATKSMIRTRTVPHGVGYNELSFEDAMGVERIHLRAQRDLDELVLNDHTTIVKGDQSNQVRGNQVEQTGGTRQSTVDEDRVETTHGDVTFHASGGERRVVLGPQSLHVGRSQTITVEKGSRVVEVQEGEHVLLSAGRMLLSQGNENHLILHTDGDAEEKKGARLVTPYAIELCAGDAKISMNADGAGTIEITSPKEIKIVVEGSTLQVTPPAIKVNQKTHPAAG